MGDDVIRLLDHLNLQKAHMVGYSMGAHIVGRLLVTHPERISSATLGAGVFPNWNAEEEKFIEETAKATEERGRTGQQLPWETEEQDFAALAACARGARYEAVTDDEIAGVTIPVLAIFGSEEVDEYATVDMKRLTIPKSSLPLLIVDGAAHVGENATYRQPEFLQAIRELVQSNSGSKPN